MHVPVFMIRQVLVKVPPPAISVLSGIVTSATKEALFVQSGALGGRVATGVPVADSSDAVAVTEASAVMVAVAVTPVTGTAGVSVTAGVDVDSGA